MFIESLKLQNFRCFCAESFRFCESKTVISGENGCGKSNLLESIFFFASAKSNRGALERDIVRHGTDHFKIHSSIKKGSHCVNIQILYEQQGGKRAYLNENPLPRLSDLLGTFNAVLFSPEDVDLVLRYPHERRRMLDILASQASNSYLFDLKLYQRNLAQRNSLLRNGLFGDSLGVQLEPWNIQLADVGARIIQYRTEATENVAPIAQNFYSRLTQGGEVLSVRYLSPAGADSVEETQSRLLDALHAQEEREKKLGYTLVGPHKDQLSFEIDGKDVQRHASKGERKSTLLSWKLAEAMFLESVVQGMPVLLLDDIFSELDRRRSECLLDLLGGFGQVILTTARDPDTALSDFEKISI